MVASEFCDYLTHFCTVLAKIDTYEYFSSKMVTYEWGWWRIASILLHLMSSPTRASNQLHSWAKGIYLYVKTAQMYIVERQTEGLLPGYTV